MNTSRCFWLRCFFAALFLLPLPVIAEDGHSHGVIEVGVIIDQDTLFIETTVPGINAVGFEALPDTEEQRKTVSDFLALMRSPQHFYEIDTANCQLVDAKSDSGMDEGHHDEADHHSDSGHGEGMAEKEHAASMNEKEHAEGMAENDHDMHLKTAAHSQFHSEYEFKCNDISGVTEIPVNFFSVLKEVEEISVSFLRGDKVAAYEITDPADAVISLE